MIRPRILNIIKQPSPILLLLLLMSMLGSCASKGICQSGELKQADAAPLLQFQKAPCYGPCPAYEANIMEDGSINLVSWGNIAVPENDTVQLCFEKQELQQLKKAIDKLNYASLQDAYLTEWTDWPSSYLTFYQNGKAVKRVKHQQGGPEALVSFLDNLHQQLMDLVAKQAKKD